MDVYLSRRIGACYYGGIAGRRIRRVEEIRDRALVRGVAQPEEWKRLERPI
jgi:hypothetical protein